MVSTAIFTLPSSSPVSLSNNSIRTASNYNPIICKFNFIRFYRNPLSLRPKSAVELLFKVPNGCVGRHSIYTSSSFKPFFRPVMEWQDCTVKMEVDVPVSVAYKCYSDREAMPKWMPFISSVKQRAHQHLDVFSFLYLLPRRCHVLKLLTIEDKPDQSRWTLKYTAFGRDIEFSWLARNLQPIPNQKIHWRSLEGLPNSGAVRFYPRGPSSCLIELTVSYEVPQILVPVASALRPFLQSLLLRGLERFSNFAKSYQSESTA